MKIRDVLRPTDPPGLPYPFIVDFFEEAANEPRSGRPYLHFPQLVAVEFRLFETGTTIGRTLRTALLELARTFSRPGQQKRLTQYLKRFADDRVRLYESLEEEKPSHFLDFFFVTELEGRGAPEDAMLRWVDKQMDIADAYQHCEATMLEGIGLGAAHPGLTEEMWWNTFERLDDEEWDDWRKLGLVIDPPARPITLEERGISVVFAVSSFLAMYYPELQEKVTEEAVSTVRI